MRKPWWLDPTTNRRSDERRRADRRAQSRIKGDRRGRDRRARAVLVSLAALASVPAATRVRNAFEDTGRHNQEGAESPEIGTEDLPPLLPETPDESSGDSRELYESIIQEAAALHGVDEDLVRAVIKVESEFDPYAVSRTGAKGLMQMMPATAKRMGVEDPFDPRQNVLGGVKYLRMLLDRFKGNVPLALAGYNAGPRKVRRYKGIPPFKETRGYVKKVLKAMAEGPPQGRETTVASAVEERKPTVIYKWTDRKGQLYLSDTPPVDKTPYVVLKSGD